MSKANPVEMDAELEQNPPPDYVQPTAPVVMGPQVYPQQPLYPQTGIVTVQPGMVPQVVDGGQQNLVIHQVGGVSGNINTPLLNQWAQRTCACCDDLEICCCGTWCWPCLACNIAWSAGESCWVPNCMIGGTLALRTKMRMAYKIRGTICEDCVTTCCCGPCVYCQMGAELKAHDDYKIC